MQVRKGVWPVMQRVLQFDSDEDFLKLSKVVLSDVGGFDLYQCRSRGQILGLISQVRPELLLIDVSRADTEKQESLLDLLFWLESLGRIPTIYLTTCADPILIRLLKVQGALAVLPKPLDITKLPSEINTRLRPGPMMH